MTLVSSFHDPVFPVAAASMSTSSESAVKYSLGKPQDSLPSTREKFCVTSSDIGERIADYLRRRYPDRTTDNVAADLAPWDIKPERIASMLRLHTGPGAVLWLALIWAYGPDFLAEVHPARLGWLAPSLRAQEIEALRREQAAIQARLDALR